MACLTCGKSAILKRLKSEYDLYKIEYYVFRYDKKENWSFCRKKYFSQIYENTKPIEYFHISEFKAN